MPLTLTFVNSHPYKIRGLWKPKIKLTIPSQRRRNTQIVILQSTFIRGTQREYSSKPLKHSIVERILVFKREI